MPPSSNTKEKKKMDIAMKPIRYAKRMRKNRHGTIE
jgi:hypothetical protein